MLAMTTSINSIVLGVNYSTFLFLVDHPHRLAHTHLHTVHAMMLWTHTYTHKCMHTHAQMKSEDIHDITGNLSNLISHLITSTNGHSSGIPF